MILDHLDKVFRLQQLRLSFAGVKIVLFSEGALNKLLLRHYSIHSMTGEEQYHKNLLQDYRLDARMPPCNIQLTQLPPIRRYCTGFLDVIDLQHPVKEVFKPSDFALSQRLARVQLEEVTVSGSMSQSLSSMATQENHILSK